MTIATAGSPSTVAERLSTCAFDGATMDRPWTGVMEAAFNTKKVPRQRDAAASVTLSPLAMNGSPSRTAARPVSAVIGRRVEQFHAASSQQ